MVGWYGGGVVECNGMVVWWWGGTVVGWWGGRVVGLYCDAVLYVMMSWYCGGIYLGLETWIFRLSTTSGIQRYTT